MRWTNESFRSSLLIIMEVQWDSDHVGVHEEEHTVEEVHEPFLIEGYLNERHKGECSPLKAGR